MENLSTPDYIAIGVIAFVVLVFMIMGFAKGLARMFLMMVGLVAAGLAAYWGFQRGGNVAAMVVPDPAPWMVGALGAAMGLAVFFVFRATFGIVLGPIKIKEGRRHHYALPGGFVGFLTGLAFVWFIMSGIKYVGSLAEMRRLRDSLSGDTVEKTDEPLLVAMKRKIEHSAPGQFHATYDFLNDAARSNLAKLFILVQNKEAITLATSDPEVRKTFGQAEVREFLETSPEFLPFIEEGQFSRVLESAKTRSVSARPEAHDVLAGADIEIALGLSMRAGRKGS